MAALRGLEEQLLATARASPGGKFTDAHFPPNAAALGLSLVSRGAEPQTFEWRRAAYHGFLLNEPLPDVVQGLVADCWFLSVAALVGRRPDLMRRVVAAEHPEAGFYIFRFYKNGRWFFVYVDDFLLYQGERPVFASSEGSANPLFPLLEKAYAKLRGSYGGLSVGPVTAAFTDLTGAFCDLTPVGPGSWAAINRALSEGWLVAACPFRPGMGVGVEIGSTGIYANHAYSLLVALQAGGNQLLNLRNPWGRLEWKGAWSDGDAAWQQPAVAAVSREAKEDGAFWMSIGDFRKHFDLLVVCRLYQDVMGPRWLRKSLPGAWRLPATAGGAQKPEANPKFLLQLTAPAKVYVALSQEDTLLRNSRRKQNLPIGFGIYAGNPPALRDGARHAAARDVTVEASLGLQPYVVVPSTFHPGEVASFWLTVFCPVEFSLQPVSM